MALNSQEAYIERLIIHQVGNKNNEDGVRCSQKQLPELDAVLEEKLNKYFLDPFKQHEFYHFYNEADINLNSLYTFASGVFDDESFVVQSANIARHLYEVSDHPQIKPGELYVVLFKGIKLNDESLDALGIFKTENKDPFLKISDTGLNYEPVLDEGISLDKLDKGCIILNVKKEDGYRVCVVDNQNKDNESRYWKDYFLKVKTLEDNYYHTQAYMQLCKSYVQERLPKAFDVNRADQIDLLNRSVDYFKKKEKFDATEFEQEVIQQPETIRNFKQYKQDYQQQHDFEIIEDFDISAPAVKKQSRVFKSVLKLDKNFHVYIHGNKELIERGYDEGIGMNYYKIFFKEEK